MVLFVYLLAKYDIHPIIIMRPLPLMVRYDVCNGVVLYIYPHAVCFMYNALCLQR